MPRSLARLVGAIAALLLACVGALVITEPARADDRIDTTLTIQATMSADRIVTGSGVLQANNAVVPNMSIAIVVDGYTVQSIATNAQGLYAFNFSMATAAPGDHTIIAQFAGEATSLKPCETSSVVRIPDAPAAQLTGSINPTATVPGSLVTVTGKLLSNVGAAVPNALISFSVNKKALRESTTSTVADGTFTSVVLLPDDAEGPLAIAATFAGNATNGTASASWTVTVTPDKDSPRPSAPASTPPSVAASPTPTVTTIATASAYATTATTVTTVTTTDSRPGPPWLLIGIGGFALFGTLVAVGFVYRDRVGRSRNRSETELLDSFIGDDAPPLQPTSPEAQLGPKRAAN